MCRGIQNRPLFKPSILGILILCILIISFAYACSTDRLVIKNETLNDFDGQRGRYKNLFQPKYDLGEETEYDHIDFLKAYERKPHKYWLVADPRGGNIDRTLGYDPSEYTIKPDFKIIQNPAHDIQITWIRHASFLIQLGGKYQILIDPVLEQWDGLAGKLAQYTAVEEPNVKSPLTAEDLPFVSGSDINDESPIIIVAISHDHLDHFNFRTLKKLPQRTRYYVPNGLEKEFPPKYSNVVGMDWYTQDTIDDLTIHFLPANHGSGIFSHEQNKTLWGGWLFEWKGYRIYFAGDTGYSDVFKDINSQAGDMDICLMPIAAWYWRHRHFAPEDAIQAAEDLSCNVFIPWAWGTWILSYEHMLEPPRRLQYAWDRMQPENMQLRILKMGETYPSKLSKSVVHE